MAASVVFHSIYGNRMGIQGLPGAAQLTVDGVAVTSPGSSQTATSGTIAQTPNSLFYTSTSAGITAFSGGGASSAVALAAVLNSVDTVAATSDSVQLPAATAGAELAVFNGGANTLAVFPKSGTTDIINALTTGTSFALGTSRMAWFTCVATGKWKSQSAAASS